MFRLGWKVDLLTKHFVRATLYTSATNCNRHDLPPQDWTGEECHAENVMMANSIDETRPKEMLAFNILKSGTSGIGPRLGRVILKRGVEIETPHYVGITSRGVIPHLSQDTFTKHTGSKGVYVPLEDFVEKSPKSTPPVLAQNNLDKGSSLLKFIGLNDDQLLILGARRSPPVSCPASNTHTAISISTSVGFHNLESEEFADAVRNLNPDIVVSLGDIPYGERPGWRRIEKMSGRTENWLKRLIDSRHDDDDDAQKFTRPSIFAPILPISIEQQSMYIDTLADDLSKAVAGLAIYDVDYAVDLPRSMAHLPRLGLTETNGPHKILREVSLGIDLFTIPFIGAATDAGIALNFTFPAPLDRIKGNEKLSLGLDMWGTEHSTDVSPLSPGCTCHACKKHHRAYIRHLLSAKEMLAWVLLQIHNLHTMDQFFIDIRRSIDEGRFEADSATFSECYESEMPDKTGQGPRVRGYQFKTEGPGEEKKNPVAFRMLDDGKEQNEEAPAMSPGTTANDLEHQGFGEAKDT